MRKSHQIKRPKKRVPGTCAVVALLFFVQPSLVRGAVVQSHMQDPEGITSLLESGFWGYTDSREGTAFHPGAPTDHFNLVAFNLGAMSNLATWAVSDFTGYAPPEPHDVNENQLSVANQYGESALQADGLAWGGYMRAVDWNGQGNRMTLRYNYKWSNPPRVFSDDGIKRFRRLRIGANLAFPTYAGPMPATSTDELGWGIINLGFRDLASEQFLTFICTVFDTRGFRTENGLTTIGNGVRRENSSRVSSGEMVVYGFIADDTRYNTRLPGSSDSRIVPFSEKVYFGYSISREQMSDIIQKANDWLTANPDDPYDPYSTDLDDWVLWEANVGIEGTRMEVNDYSFTMSYIGEHFDISSEYERAGPLFTFRAEEE